MRNTYKLTLEDDREYLIHHGVKGMRWGEWNEETKQRYGIVDNGGGLSKFKAFRDTSYTLPAGSPVNRFSNAAEASKGTDLSKPFLRQKQNTITTCMLMKHEKGAYLQQRPMMRMVLLEVGGMTQP